MQVKKRGISLKQLTDHCPGMDELTDGHQAIPPVGLGPETANPDDSSMLMVTLDDLLLEVLEELEDTLELLSADSTEKAS